MTGKELKELAACIPDGAEVTCDRFEWRERMAEIKDPIYFSIVNPED